MRGPYGTVVLDAHRIPNFVPAGMCCKFWCVCQSTRPFFKLSCVCRNDAQAVGNTSGTQLSRRATCGAVISCNVPGQHLNHINHMSSLSFQICFKHSCIWWKRRYTSSDGSTQTGDGFRATDGDRGTAFFFGFGCAETKAGRAKHFFDLSDFSFQHQNSFFGVCWSPEQVEPDPWMRVDFGREVCNLGSKMRSHLTQLIWKKSSCSTWVTLKTNLCSTCWTCRSQ